MGTKSHDVKNPIFKPSNITIDNEAAIAITKCNINTAGNTHINEMCHYIGQGTAVKNSSLNGLVPNSN